MSTVLTSIKALVEKPSSISLYSAIKSLQGELYLRKKVENMTKLKD